MSQIKKGFSVISLIFISIYFNTAVFANNEITSPENNNCNLSGKIFLLDDQTNKVRNLATESRKILFHYDENQGNYLTWHWGSINESRSYFCSDGEISATGVGIVQYTGKYMPEKKRLFWNGYTYIEYQQ